VGTGPYRLAEYRPGESVRLQRNPDYWMRDEAGRRLPYLLSRLILIMSDPAQAYAAFLAGETDIHTCRPEEVDELRRRSSELGIRVVSLGFDTGQLFVAFNRNPRHYRHRNGKNAPQLRWFTDKRFLRALAHGVDKHTIIRRYLHGHGRPAATAISPENKRFYDRRIEDYRYDPDLARRLLDESGYTRREGEAFRRDPDGNPVRFSLYTNAGNALRSGICALLRESWSRLGILVDFTPLEPTLLAEKLESTYDWDAALVGFTGGIDPGNARALWRSDSALHLWRPRQKSPATAWEAEVDTLLDADSRELNPDRRRAHYQRLEEILHDELPVIQIVRARRFVASKLRLKNFRPTIWGIDRPERLRFSD